ncbi:MAG: 7-cyano-7-deazaguanine synthase [Planctomycetota bacterium]|jgi:7-cyano-7-deazaguanine synthase
MQSAVVLLSGGIGSTAAAFRCRQDTLLHPLHLDYGRESAASERAASAAIADTLSAPLEVLELPHVARVTGLRPAPPGGEESSTAAPPASPDEVDGLMATMLAVGAEYAAAVGADALITGRTAEPLDGGSDQLSLERSVDHRRFHHAFAIMLEAALPSIRAIQLETPLIDLQPFEVVKLARRFDAPLERTWSCHGKAPPCGTCPGCKTRAAAFAKAGLIDPLLQPADR